MKKKPKVKSKVPNAPQAEQVIGKEPTTSQPLVGPSVGAFETQDCQEMAEIGRDSGPVSPECEPEVVERGSLPLADPTDEQLAVCLADGWTKEAAADETGVGARTVYRRQSQRGFKERVQFLMQEKNERIAARLGWQADAALDTFGRILHPKKVHMADVRAAAMVIDRWFKVSERQRKSARESQLETEMAALINRCQELESQLSAPRRDGRDDRAAREVK